MEDGEYEEVYDREATTKLRQLLYYQYFKVRGAIPCQRKKNIQKNYHAATLMVARWVKESYCFQQSSYKICKSLGWNLPNQQIKKEEAMFAHKLIISQRPIQILRKIRYPRSRQSASLSIRYKKKNEKYECNLISQSIKFTTVYQTT